MDLDEWMLLYMISMFQLSQVRLDWKSCRSHTTRLPESTFAIHHFQLPTHSSQELQISYFQFTRLSSIVLSMKNESVPSYLLLCISLCSCTIFFQTPSAGWSSVDNFPPNLRLATKKVALHGPGGMCFKGWRCVGKSVSIKKNSILN